MADSILRMRVDSTNYDSNLKSAAQALTRMAGEARKTGRILNVLEDENRDYIKSLGEMGTKSMSAKGSLNELTAAFRDISMVYKQMSAEEKKGEFGRELNKQLEQLKTRIREGRAEMDNINQSINGGLGETLNNLAGKFGLNVSALMKFGGAGAAVTAALKVAKDAFFASESNLDEWSRAVYSAQSTYQAFLTSLNTGDVSGFLSNIGQIVKAAREAYNELDTLSTMKAINAAPSSAQQVENERMRMMLQTGRYIAPRDGRRASMADGSILSDAQKRQIEARLQNGLKTANKYVEQEIAQAGKAIGALYREQAARLGMSEAQFRKGTANWGVFSSNLAGYNKYRQFEQEHTVGINTAQGTIYQRDSAANPYTRFKAWGVFKDDGELYKKIVEQIQARDNAMRGAYQSVSQSYRTINRVEGFTARIGGGTTGGKGGGTAEKTFTGGPVAAMPLGSMAALNAQMRELVELQNLATSPAIWQNYAAKIDEVRAKMDALQGKVKEEAGPFAGRMQEVWSEFERENPLMPLEIEKRREQANPLETAKTVAGGAGQIAGGLQQMGVKLPEEINKGLSVVNGLISVIEGVQTVLSIFQTGAMTANTTALVANTASNIALAEALAVNTVASAIPFHTGGVVRAARGFAVPGNFGYDAVPALLQSGEVVLNRAQQGNLASQMNESRTIVVEGVVSADTIRLVMNNNGKRTGAGELVTTRLAS